MEEYLTIEEINRRFRAQWVLLENPKTNRKLEVQGGRVRYHGKNRDAVDRELMKLRPKRFAMFYTGKIVPKGTAIIL